ncbi:efflux RND transporter periplasmic adaptor subunit [Leptobacterium sp. I13]|uniref:efflux RND transporter periplasmic adaptor subunit n=1 Tax=Leptobacterium meishanense TaxID=3128904 RepID=UPI0030EE58E9
MKYIYIILSAAFILTSCANGSKKTVEELIEEGNLDALRTKRGELVIQNDLLNTQLSELDEAIAKLDTVKKLALVSSFTVKDTLFNHYVEIQGSVDTKQNIIIFAEYSGVLYKIYVKKGEAVKKGQLLAKIDDGGLSQQLAQMQVQANLAKTTYERQKRLWDQKIGSEIQYLQAKSTYEAQSEAVAQMRNQLAKTSITAPFSGIIDEIFSEQGSVVAPGREIMRIVNLNDMYIEAEVPEKYLADIKKGTHVQVEFPILGETVNTKVRQVSNYINPNNRSFKIEVGVPNTSGNIKPNLTAKLRINDYTNKAAILIPQSIVSENADGEQYVYIASSIIDSSKEAIAQRAIIETGKTQGDIVEVIKGVASGDAIIKEGARSVKDGQKVKLINKK